MTSPFRLPSTLRFLVLALAVALLAACASSRGVRMVDAGSDASATDGGVHMDGGARDSGPVMCTPSQTTCRDDAGVATACADLMTDPQNCGSCGMDCGSSGACSGGHCMCPGGVGSCFGHCADLMTDVNYCGSCAISCGPAGTCTAGLCTACDPTWTHCPSGACAETMTDNHNCGSCGHACAAAETCVGGMCSCGAPRADCGAGCIDTTTDRNNCGMCGNSCGAHGACAGSVCTCAAGTMMCGTACSDVTSDSANCGTCGHACPAMQVCIASACVSAPLYHGWTSPLAGCTTTGYTTTAPTNLGGMYPFNTGDSNSCRAWKLAATICTTMPTLYTDTTNWQCPTSGGFTDPVFGTYCLVANQYACSTCPGACNAMCEYNPLSLRNCAGSEANQM